MFDNADLEAAVRAGAITADAADRLRVLAAERRGAPAADEERFGIVGGLADIMAAIGLLLLLGIGLFLTVSVSPIGACLITLAAWALAEHFTRRRRMTLSSFMLFGLFTISWSMMTLAVALTLPGPAMVPVHGSTAVQAQLTPIRGLIVAAGATMGAAAWWLRFRFPIAYAVALVAGLNLIVHLGRLIAPAAPADLVSLVLLACGIAAFGIAMWWDMSDIRRETIRSDVAFWVHAVAGYQIAHAGFRILIGVPGEAAGWDRAFVYATLPAEGAILLPVVTLFLLFCLLALAIDRRSLLLSSLGFVLPALATMSGVHGMVGILAGLMAAGAVLLFLSTFWTKLRALLLALLPVTVRAQLPRTAIAVAGPRPVR